MHRLPNLSTSEVVKALGKAGYVFNRQKGSHIILVNREKHKIAVVPNRKEIPRGTLRAIMNEAELTIEDFLKLL
jgi:predicted RNA binding protein YcfA (HicA-like mRNA interferase family)